jgi:hypothetical protein
LAANKQVNNLFVVKQLIELKSMACITASLHLEHGSVYYSELYSKSHVIGQVSTLNMQRIHLEAALCICSAACNSGSQLNALCLSVSAMHQQ